MNFLIKTHASDFALMRYILMENDAIDTNADFIIKKFLKNERNAKIPPTVLNKLLQIKTEELILWNVAKTYWKKAQGEEYKKSKDKVEFTKFNLQRV